MAKRPARTGGTRRGATSKRPKAAGAPAKGGGASKAGAGSASAKKRTPAKAAKRAGGPAMRPEHDDPAAVDALLDTQGHGLRAVIEAVRKAVLSAEAGITEGVKWNSASFYRRGWFATVNARSGERVLVVLHHGAKVRTGVTLRETLQDRAGLLTWHSADRASVGFASEAEFAARRAAFVEVVGQWARAQGE